MPGESRSRFRRARGRPAVDPDAPWTFSQSEIAEPWRAVRLPGGKYRLMRLCGYHAAGLGGHLNLLLRDPAIQAMLAASPAMVRLLRPFVAMLGLDVHLLPARAKRGRRVADDAARAVRGI